MIARWAECHRRTLLPPKALKTVKFHNLPFKAHKARSLASPARLGRMALISTQLAKCSSVSDWARPVGTGKYNIPCC